MHTNVLVAPFNATHGQGNVSRFVLNNTINFNYNFDTSLRNRNIFHFIISVFRLLYFLFILNFKSKVNIFYFTPSRSFSGVIRDVLCFLFLFSPFINPHKIVLHVHGSDHKSFFDENSIISIFLRFFYNYFKMEYILLSPSHKDYTFIGLNSNLHYISNFHNVLKPPINQDSKNLQPKKFVFASHPLSGKRLDLALEFLSQNFNDWSLDVYGWTHNDFKKLYPSTQKFNNIKFFGLVSPATLVSKLSNYDCMIFISDYVSEAQPLVIIDALASGLPVIINDFKMLKDFSAYPGVYFTQSFQGDLSYNKNQITYNYNLFSRDRFIKDFYDVVR